MCVSGWIKKLMYDFKNSFFPAFTQQAQWTLNKIENTFNRTLAGVQNVFYLKS